MAFNKTNYNKTIVAVLPTCNEKGKNVCKVIFQNGEEEIQNIRTERFIENWFWDCKTTRERLNYNPKTFKETARLNNLVVISLMKLIVLIPIKCREAKESGDEIYGYIRQDKFEYKKNDIIGLLNNIEVPCLSSTDSVKENLEDANYFELVIKEEYQLDIVREKIIYNKAIIAVIPTYNKKGENVCKVIFQDGKEEVQDISTETFMDNWFNNYRMNRKSKEKLSEDLKEIFLSKVLVSASISENLVLMPIKCREAKHSGDEIYGYIRHHNYEYMKNNVIGLGDNIEVPCLSSKNSVEERLRFAEFVVLIEKEQKRNFKSAYANK